jgi:hypothetical protein
MEINELPVHSRHEANGQSEMLLDVKRATPQVPSKVERIAPFRFDGSLLSHVLYLLCWLEGDSEFMGFLFLPKGFDFLNLHA